MEDVSIFMCPFCTLYGYLDIFYVHLEYFVDIGIFFPVLAYCTKKIWQPWMQLHSYYRHGHWDLNEYKYMHACSAAKRKRI
jgi:hypothetical protein